MTWSQKSLKIGLFHKIMLLLRGFWHLALLKLDRRDQKPWIWALWVSPDPQVPMGTLGEVVQFLAMFW